MENLTSKENLIKTIKRMGKRKPARIENPVMKVGNVSSQYFAETEVLAKSYQGSKNLKLRETLRNICTD